MAVASSNKLQPMEGGDDVLQVRCIHDGALWCLSARVLDQPKTIVYVVSNSWPQALLDFRQSLAKLIDDADLHHEEFPIIAARLIALRWRRLQFVEVKK